MNLHTSVEEKIIEGTIACIEKYGISGTTNRRIAQIAGVNSAAINYYFRSKTALVDKVMEITLNNAFDWQDVEKLPSSTANERCIAVFNHIITGACNFPGITRAHFYDVLIEGKTDTPAVERLNAFLMRLADNLKELGSPMKMEALRFAVTQIAAACLMVSIAPRMYFKPFGLDMNNAGSRLEFVTGLVSKLLM